MARGTGEAGRQDVEIDPWFEQFGIRPGRGPANSQGGVHLPTTVENGKLMLAHAVLIPTIAEGQPYSERWIEAPAHLQAAGYEDGPTRQRNIKASGVPKAVFDSGGLVSPGYAEGIWYDFDPANPPQGYKAAEPPLNAGAAEVQALGKIVEGALELAAIRGA